MVEAFKKKTSFVLDVLVKCHVIDLNAEFQQEIIERMLYV